MIVCQDPNEFTMTTIRSYIEIQIVRFNEAEIILDTASWWTATTKNRMNQVSQQCHLGYRVFTQNGTWYVDYLDKTHEFSAPRIRLDRTTGEVMPAE